MGLRKVKRDHPLSIEDVKRKLKETGYESPQEQSKNKSQSIKGEDVKVEGNIQQIRQSVGDQDLTDVKSTNKRILKSDVLDCNSDKKPFLDCKLRNPEVQINGDYIIYVGEANGKIYSKDIGKLIEICKISKNIETLEIKYDLDIHTFDGRIVSIYGLDRKNIYNKRSLLELSAYGSEINPANLKIYIKSFENQEKLMSIENYHLNIGWGKYEEKLIFKNVEAIGMPEGYSSSYKGLLDISSDGSLVEWLEFIKEEIIGNVPLEAAIAIGLSSVVVGFIGEQIGVNSQMFHIYGNSSTGKTTAGELIISMATKPSLQNHGLMHSWSGTVNAIIGNLRNNFGLPILFDDSSVSRIKKFSSLLYQMVQGRDKDRLTKEAEMSISETWRTTIISTGEQSLIENSNQNEGLRVRVIEIGDVSWTKDAAHSERIKRKVSKYHGQAANIVARELILLGEDRVLELVEKSKLRGKKYLEGKKKYSRLHDRILNTIATLEIGITLLEKKINLGFNIEGIMNFILDHTLMDDRSMAEKAYEDILEYVNINNNRFQKSLYKIYESNNSTIFSTSSNREESQYPRQDISINTNQELLGKIEDVSITEVEDKEGKKLLSIERQIIIPAKKFQEIVKELGYTNPSGILKDFKDKGLLSHDKDRSTRKRKLLAEGSLITVNIIKVREEILMKDIH